jgi:hypothetical protein
MFSAVARRIGKNYYNFKSFTAGKWHFTVRKLFQNYVLTHQHIMEIVLLAT